MNRPHAVRDFKETVGNFRKKIPDISISTDIIVGYCGESDDEFKETIKLIEEIKPDIVNLSKFTVRKGTKAEKLKQLPTEVIKERSRLCSEVVKRVCEEKNKEYIGKTVDVLALEKAKGTKGRTDNYKQVVIRQEVELGKRVKVKITDANHGSLFGEIVES
jgi:tRNA A37 methylthiotransferase MiaB